MKNLTLLFFIIFSTPVTMAQVLSFNIDESKIDHKLAAQLDSIFKLDQLVRNNYLNAKKINRAPQVVDSLLKVMLKSDQENLAFVNGLIDKYGWLGPQKVGFNGANGLFLVIQHADLKTQQHYLPIVREAEKRGELLSSHLAMLEDRINMREGKKQLYGSQGFIDYETGRQYIYPVADIDNLDNRRKAMGMPPMKQYETDWNVEEYKKQLPEIERIVKRQFRPE